MHDKLIPILEWLLDLDQIRIGRDAPLSLQWHPPLEPWLLFAGAILAALLIVWNYAREAGPVWRRALPAVLRAALVTLVAAMLCGPVLVLQRNREERSHVALLVDASASMGRHDVYLDPDLAREVEIGARLGEAESAAGLQRLDLVRRTLLADDGAALRALAASNDVRLFSFSESARLEAEFSHGTGGTGPDSQPARQLEGALAALAADGPATDIPAAVQQALQRGGGGPLAAIVLVSDGQSTETAGFDDAADAARAAQVPIYAICVGSPDPPKDIVVGPVMGEDNVFVKDLLALRVRLRALGLPEPTPVLVEVFEDRDAAGKSTGAAREATPLAAETVELGCEVLTREVELRVKPTRTGRVRYRVEARPLVGEIELGNNSDYVDVSILDDHLHLLYVEGYPRFDYRYLKNALLRETTIRFGALLLSADASFVQEGSEPVRRFPETPDELDTYDVVLFGDVDPGGDWISPTQLDLLVDFVGKRGGGFGLIAGERWAPLRFRGTPLERLIPVRIDPEFTGRYETALTSSFQPQLTAEGRRSRLLRFRSDPDESVRVFDGLPDWYWVARTLGPRPGAEVLVEHPSLQTLSGPMPLVVLGRYGAGRTFFQASDDTWRWRRDPNGELLLDAYWVQVARALLQPRQIGQDRRLVIAPEQTIYRFGDRCVVRVEVRDEDTLAALEQDGKLVVFDGDQVPVARATLDRLGPASRVFEATFVPPRPGSFTLQADNILPPAGQRPATAFLRVEDADLESRRPEADNTTLRRLAEQTGGQLVPLDHLRESFASIRDRSIRIPDDISEPLWDSKLAFLLFILIIGMEWVLRKVFGML